MDSWQLRLGDGGWVEFQHPDLPSVFVHFRQTEDDRLEAFALFVERTEEPITSNLLREIRIGQLESIANGPGAREMIVHHLGWLDDVDRATETWLETIVPAGGRPHRQRRPRLKLNVPDTHRLPDEFFERFAELYSWLAGPGGSHRPAVEIAEKNGIALTTVHRWVKEARRRGFLAAGRRREQE